jgi:hypothetical protein
VVPTWLIVVLAVLVVLAAGGAIARRLQLRRTRGAFERTLAQVDRDLAAAAAQDRGWDREHLLAAARRIAREQLGEAELEELTLVEVHDRPGTDADEAVFRVRAGGRGHRVVLGRHAGEWTGAAR